MKKVYIQTNVLPHNFGGRTKSILKRANLLDNAGFDVEIIFTGMQYDFKLQFANLYQKGMVNPNIKLTAMMDDLRAESDLLTYQYKVDFNYEEPENTERIYHPINDSLCEVKFTVPHTKKVILRDFIASDGTLIRRNYYRTFGYTTDGRLFNPDGSTMATISNSIVNEKNTVTGINYMNGKYPPFKTTSFSKLKAYWLKQYINPENAVLIVDARTEDYVACKAGIDIKKYFVFHSNHYSLKQQEVKKNWRYILGQEPNENLRFICLTEEQKNDIIKCEEYNGVTIDVIGHPIDSSPVNTNYDDRRFVIISRMDKNKNILDSVRAFRRFNYEYPEYRLDIFGIGSQMNYIQTYIDFYKLDNIKLHGYTKDPQTEFANSLATIVTTGYEGFGLAIGESISCGCPIVSYPFKYGQKDLIIDGVSGLVAQERTIDALYTELVNITQLKQDRQQIADSIKRYNTENITKQWHDLLEDDRNKQNVNLKRTSSLFAKFSREKI